MHPADLEREQDIEHLRRVALAQHAQLEQLIAALARKCKELKVFKGSRDELQQTLALIETLTKKQSVLLADPSKNQAPPSNDRSSNDGGKKGRDKTGPTEQSKLRIVETPCTLPSDERMCDACGGEMFEMAGQFEESELIDVIEVEYVMRHVKRQKYACRCGGCMKTAPGPERAIDGCRYPLDVAIKIIIDKYLYHLPLARQVRIMEQHGLAVTPQTLWDQLYAIAQRLQVTADRLIKHVMDQPVIGLDQTSWPRLDAR